MRVVIVLLWCLAVAGMVCGGALAQAGETTSRLYRDRTGKSEVFFCWQISAPNPETRRIVSRKANATYRNICRPNGRTLRWEVAKSGVTGTAWVDGATLRLRGAVDGEAVAWQRPVAEAGWFQPLSFALRGVARGEETTKRLVTLRPDTLEPMSIRATRKGVEQVVIEGQAVEAVRVQIRLTGWLRMLWHGDYWFRTGDWVFVRYEGVNGPPGTPKTEIVLIEENIGNARCWDRIGKQEESRLDTAGP